MFFWNVMFVSYKYQRKKKKINKIKKKNLETKLLCAHYLNICSAAIKIQYNLENLSKFTGKQKEDGAYV